MNLLKKLKRVLKELFVLKHRSESFTYHNIYDNNGLDGLLNSPKFSNLPSFQRFKVLRSIAKREWEGQNKKIATDVATKALGVESNPNFAKWTAFRLYDIGFVSTALNLLDENKSGFSLSDNEKNRYTDIQEHKKFLNSKPEIPNARSAKYSSSDTKLLYVTASCLPYHTSGYTTRTHELLLSLKESGKQFIVLTRPGYPYDRKDSHRLPKREITNYDGIDYHHIATPSSKIKLGDYFNESGEKIARFAESHNVSLVHAASNYVNAIPALFAAKMLGLRFQYEMRGLWDMTRATKIEGYKDSERYNVGMSLEYYVAQSADTIFCISIPLKAHLIEKKIAKDKIQLLPNCINNRRFFSLLGRGVKKHRNFTIGFAGTLNDYEGLDLLLESLKVLKKRGVLVNLKVIGTGPSHVGLKSYSQKLKIVDQVEFTGRLEPHNARQELSKVHLVVIPRKPFSVCKVIPPIKLVESIALGIPTVVSNLSALRDEIRHCNQSSYFAPYNAESLAEKILEYFTKHDYNVSSHLRSHLNTDRDWSRHSHLIFPSEQDPLSTSALNSS